MAKKNILKEIDREPKRRPYGARIDFFLDEEGIQFSLDGPASLLATDDAIVQLDLAPDQPLGPLKDKKLYRANIEGFATAGEAEAMGPQAVPFVAVVCDHEIFRNAAPLPFSPRVHYL